MFPYLAKHLRRPCSIADDKLEASQVRKRRNLQDTGELWCCCSSCRYCFPSGNTPCASRRLLPLSGVGLASIRSRVSCSDFSEAQRWLSEFQMPPQICTSRSEIRPTDHTSPVRQNTSLAWLHHWALCMKSIQEQLQTTKSPKWDRVSKSPCTKIDSRKRSHTVYY